MDTGLAVLHILVGLLFVGHGAQKLFGVFGGSGLEGTAGMFDSIGLRPGWLHARAAGTAELLGGALLALGTVHARCPRGADRRDDRGRDHGARTQRDLEQQSGL